MRVVLELDSGAHPISGIFSRPDSGESVEFSGTLELLALLESTVTTGLPSAAPVAPSAPATNSAAPVSSPGAAPAGAATGGVAPVAHRVGDGAPRGMGQ